MKKILLISLSIVLALVIAFLGVFILCKENEPPVDKTKDYLLTVKAEELEVDGKLVKMGYAYCSDNTAVKYGTEVWVAAAPVGGYEFEGWYKGKKKVSKKQLYSFELEGNTDLVAKFSEVKKGDYKLPEEDLKAEDTKTKLFAGESEYFNISTVINEGNRARIAKVLKKAQSGEDLLLVGIGGSVTEGLNGGMSYGSYVKFWLQDLFPEIDITYINSGIGSTGSDVGVHRLETDVLNYEPDLVFVEFCVNDISLRNQNWPYLETYEGIIRRLLQKNVAVIAPVLGATDYTDPKFQNTALSGHLAILLHYDIPVIDYYGALWRYIDAGVFTWFTDDTSKISANELLTHDGLHPSVLGHELISSSICFYLNNVYENMEDIDEDADEFPEEPFFSDVYDTATFYASDEIYSFGYNIVEATSTTGEVTNSLVHGTKLGSGWKCRGAGSSVTLEFKGVKSVYIFLAHNKTDFGKGTVTINGETVLNNVSTKSTSNHIWPYYNKVFDKPTDVTITFTSNEGIFGVGPIGIVK